MPSPKTASPKSQRPIRQSKIQDLKSKIALVYSVFWVVLAIAPFDRSDWLLENLLVFVTAAFLLATHRRLQLSDLSYVFIAVFLTLHAIGAHYTYEHVPLGDWLRAPLGFRRNHFDRIVHFAFGLLLTYPLAEALHRMIKVAWKWAGAFSFAIVL
ncbi:MAG: DUF2238 domain-containing protein, partial [Acidobacteriota bacterium]